MNADEIATLRYKLSSVGPTMLLKMDIDRVLALCDEVERLQTAREKSIAAVKAMDTEMDRIERERDEARADLAIARAPWTDAEVDAAARAISRIGWPRTDLTLDVMRRIATGALDAARALRVADTHPQLPGVQK